MTTFIAVLHHYEYYIIHSEIALAFYDQIIKGLDI